MRRTPRTFGLLAVAALLAVPACSGDDDSATDDPAPTTPTEASDPVDDAEPAEAPSGDADAEPSEPADEPASDAPSDDPDDDGDTVFVDDISELPDECVDLVTDMLQEIEPLVSEIDWETASLDDLEALMAEVEDEFEALDEIEEDSGCARYEFADDAESFDAMLELAEEEAPGAVGWLTFIRDMFATMPGSGEDAAEGGPADCDEAIAYLEDVIAEGGTMSSLPLSEVTAVSQAFTVVTTDCDAATMGEFIEREDVSAFLS